MSLQQRTVYPQNGSPVWLPVWWLCLLVSLVSGGVHGNAVHTPEAFDRVHYQLPYDVEFVLSDAPFVEASGGSLEDIRITVRRGELTLSQSRGWLSWMIADADDLRLTIGYTQLDGIILSGSGDVYARELDSDQIKLSVRGSGVMEAEQVSANDLHLLSSGSGDIILHDVDVDTLNSAIKGSGDIQLRGTTNNFELSIQGSGDYLADKLRAQETQLSIQGSGDVTLWSEHSLDVSIMGSGNVTYYGNPRVTRSILGSGRVQRAGSNR
ncbi:MAG: head GIN domain-containing protein [Pseudomonadota bacterium]